MSTAVKLSKLLITRYKNKLFAISYDTNTANEIEYIENNSLLGSIHIGRVKKISKNINAAFVEIEYNKERQTVYFDMPDVKYIIFADEKEHNVLHEGDDIVIKISKLPIKNKLAGATANISDVSTEVLDNIKARKNYIKSPSMLYAGESDYIEIIKDRLKYTTFDIVTDIKEVYEKILSFLKENHSELADRVRLYEDPMISMNKLYSIDTLFESALDKRVWLKDGGYLFIEPTEALTVIDVNTGKNVQKKDVSAVKLKTNLEAIKESARQMRLRNISGIIVIDLINTADKSEVDLLYHTMKDYLKEDRLNTVAIDITKLCLFEITRRKRKPSLLEVMRTEWRL
ncbi:ribonuclease E/G [Lachnoanaerobaculum saburreum]|uniref:Ribonuclease, Rne/Rng family n=1 Tax=Lachnoanaerobaculum saburreum TaxID=467210 RepID=A0A133ZPQ5_9FIRM|nr:ribonuclease E/G [Lachnoanaerobaculum saburreum]KXB57402.1 ribonuclease, Rne/Rng family [Lachnoanaerobaculum saburreum]